MIRNGAFSPDVGEELDRGERADRGAAHAGAEDADREAAALRREPGVDERDADGEGGAGDAEEEPADQQQGVGVEGDEGDEEDRHDRDAPRRAGTSPGRRSGRSARRPTMRPSEPTSTGTATSSATSDSRERRRACPVSRNSGPERADQRPGPEVDREADGGQRQHQPRRTWLRRTRRRVGARRRHLVLLHGITSRKGGPSPPWQRAGTCGSRRPGGLRRRTGRPPGFSYTRSRGKQRGPKVLPDPAARTAVRRRPAAALAVAAGDSRDAARAVGTADPGRTGPDDRAAPQHGPGAPRDPGGAWARGPVSCRAGGPGTARVAVREHLRRAGDLRVRRPRRGPGVRDRPHQPRPPGRRPPRRRGVGPRPRPPARGGGHLAHVRTGAGRRDPRRPGLRPRAAAGRPLRPEADPLPLLEAARRHRDVVCGVHLGIVRGALEEYAADPADSALVPFAEPGACLLVVPPRTPPHP